jgi:hypothetical protein
LITKIGRPLKSIFYQDAKNICSFFFGGAFSTDSFYLETGQDSILNYINSKGNFDLVKTIKGFNDTVSWLQNS